MMFAGTKKCRPRTRSGRFVSRGHRVDVERRRVAGENRVRLGDRVELARRLRFLTSRFSKTASTTTSASRELVPIVGEANRLAALPGLFLREPALLHLVHEHAHHRLARLVDGFVVGVDDDDRNAGLRERDRDAAAHRPGRRRRRALSTRPSAACHPSLSRRTPGIFASSRSAKKMWRSACEGSERTSSSKSRASRAMPNANGSSTAACDGVDRACARRSRRSLPAAPSCALARRRTARLARASPSR